MRSYLDLAQRVLDTGIRQSNRTGTDTLTIPGEMLKVDLRQGFPAVTTKRLAFGQLKGELLGFLRGATSAATFRELGCTVWDQNANENGQWLANFFRKGPDDLGPIYGAQWRNFNNQGVDQLANALEILRLPADELRKHPALRRIRVTAWNPKVLDRVALPACHTDFQFLPHIDDKVLHMTVSMRSVDVFLGLPFNVASYALLLQMFADLTGYEAGTLTMFLADCHIYVNHLDQIREQLKRDPLPPPAGVLLDYPSNPREMSIDDLASMSPAAINLVDYKSHGALPAPMAV